MNKHRLVLNKLIEKYSLDSNVRGLLLYGSMAKGLETENSDIDLWIYRDNGGFIHSIDKIQGIKIDLFEISVPMLEKYISCREAPVINSLLEGVFLYNKDIDADRLVDMAYEIKQKEFIPIETMPRNRIINLLLQLHDLVDDATDLVDDRYRFNIIFSELIVGIYNNLYDFFGIWRESAKKTLDVFETSIPEIYPIFLKIIDDSEDPRVRVKSAEIILDIMAQKYGGIPEAHVLTEIKQ